MEEKYMTRQEVAECLSVSIKTVDRMARNGALPRYAVYGMPRFRASDVMKIPLLTCSRRG